MFCADRSPWASAGGTCGGSPGRLWFQLWTNWVRQANWTSRRRQVGLGLARARQVQAEEVLCRNRRRARNEKEWDGKEREGSLGPVEPSRRAWRQWPMRCTATMLFCGRSEKSMLERSPQHHLRQQAVDTRQRVFGQLYAAGCGAGRKLLGARSSDNGRRDLGAAQDPGKS